MFLKTRITALALMMTASAGWGIAQAESRRNAVVEAVERVSPAVVNISTERTVRQPALRPPGFFWSPFDDLFRERYYRTESLGSGVIVDPRGYVVTNDHVIRQASRIVVAVADGTEYEADLIGTDSRNDVAVIRIRLPEGEAIEFPFLAFGRSDDLMIGETVIAVGNPQGFHNTVTVGVISALERRIYVNRQEYPGLIQTDAAINPGSSGGPLLNINGDLIGITMAMAHAENIGFAVPSQRVERIFEQFVKGRISLMDSMGLDVENIPPRVARYLGLPSNEGVIVTTVVPDGYGHQAGLEAEDVIIELDGNPVTSVSDYNRRLTEHAEDSPLRLKFLRDGQAREVSIQVQPRFNLSEERLEKPWFGLVVVGIDSSVARSLNIDVDEGVLVYSVEKDSPAAQAGLRPGDIIQSIGRKKVSSIGDYRQARALLGAFDTVEMLILRVGRHQRVRYVVQLNRAA
ncbi:MAG TPA: PDZ domain-containing protein [Firmicutes bacterium]|nr:PDZ domain-containing protein [Bacillota bacterium]